MTKSSGRSGGLARGAVALVVLVVAVAAGLLVVRAVNDKPRLVLIGDSLTTVSAAPINDTLGDRDVEIIAVGGARADQMGPIVDDKVSGDPPVVIINLGTNDAISGTPVEATVEALRQLVERFPDACRRLVTINEAMYSTRNPDLGAETDVLNNEIVRLADEVGVELIRWDEVVAEYLAAGEPDGPLLSDTVHPTPLGQQRLADLYRESIESC